MNSKRMGQDETVVVVRNQRSAGRADHWLIIPKPGPAVRHIRDVEALTVDDLPLRMRVPLPLIRSIFPFTLTSKRTHWLKKHHGPPCSQGNEQGKKEAPQGEFPGSLSQRDPQWLPSWSSRSHRTHRLA